MVRFSYECDDKLSLKARPHRHSAINSQKNWFLDYLQNEKLYGCYGRLHPTVIFEFNWIRCRALSLSNFLCNPNSIAESTVSPKPRGRVI